MTTTTLPSSAETAVTDVRQLLTPSTQIYSSYVHTLNPRQVVFHEYGNMTEGTQKLTAVLVTTQGQILPGSSPKTYRLEPQGLLRIDTSEWARSTGIASFSGQILILVEEDTAKKSPKHIYPAITAHWISPLHHCEIATAAFGQINLKRYQGKKSFYMYCSMAVYDAVRTTYVVLFNHSTDSDYQDTVELQASLCGKEGQRLDGPPVTIAPFGAVVLDIGEHFGPSGQKFLTENAGHVGVAMHHLGHTFPAYFFHIDRNTHDILSGQHAQPPMAALTHFGIWWGKLRQFGL